jgi:hypothetical protein
MHDLLFTIPGYPHPFEESVTVSWSNDVFTFTLSEGGVARSGDRCRPGNAAEVLDSFLVQLIGGEPAARASGTNDYDRVVQTVKAAWEQGCPVASDPAATATAALRRIASVSRQLKGVPSRVPSVMSSGTAWWCATAATGPAPCILVERGEATA